MNITRVVVFRKGYGYSPMLVELKKENNKYVWSRVMLVYRKTYIVPRRYCYDTQKIYANYIAKINNTKIIFKNTKDYYDKKVKFCQRDLE